MKLTSHEWRPGALLNIPLRDSPPQEKPNFSEFSSLRFLYKGSLEWFS